jgi:hypothetical protein
MLWGTLLLEVAILLAISGIAALVKAYLPSYLAEKGKNLATKEDVAAITREVESIRHEYAEHLESLAHQNRVILERSSRRHQLRIAALERRLDVHQHGYSLWVKLVGSVYREDQLGNVVMECQDWWQRHCLYLDGSARQAFRDAYMAAGHHHDLVKAREDAPVLRESWGTIMRAGEVLVTAVELPSIAGVDSGIQDKGSSENA